MTSVSQFFRSDTYLFNRIDAPTTDYASIEVAEQYGKAFVARLCTFRLIETLTAH
jgi:hypothetical protein